MALQGVVEDRVDNLFVHRLGGGMEGSDRRDRHARLRLHAERRQLDPAQVLAEHGDATGVALLAGGGELEGVFAGQAQVAAAVALEAEALQGHGVIQQFHALARAVLLGQGQCTLADAMGAPPPGGARDNQHENEKIAQVHFGFLGIGASAYSLRRRAARGGCSQRVNCAPYCPIL